LSFVTFALLKNHPKSAQKLHTVSNGSIRFSVRPPQIFIYEFPVRVHVFVIRLAKFEGQAGCQPREHSPHARLVVSNLHPALRPIPAAELVSNPTPPGQILCERSPTIPAKAAHYALGFRIKNT